MRYRSLVVAILAFVFGGALRAWATDPGVHFYFNTTSAATYADGKPILDGERFLLVWFDTGVTIDLTKDITWDKDSFIGSNWRWARLATAVSGCCPNVNFSLTSSQLGGFYQRGRFQLYLLDTRVSDTQLAPLVKNSYGVDFPSTINAVVPIEGVTHTWTSYWVSPVKVEGLAPATTAWTHRPVDTPTPVIVSMVFTNDVATVGVTNTLSTVNYILKGSLDLTFTNTFWEAASKAGAADALTPLVLSDTSATNAAAFYRIETSTK